MISFQEFLAESNNKGMRDWTIFYYEGDREVVRATSEDEARSLRKKKEYSPSKIALVRPGNEKSGAAAGWYWDDIDYGWYKFRDNRKKKDRPKNK